MESDDEDLRQAAGLSTILPSLHVLLSCLHQEPFELVQRLSPSVLAYLGDAVYELYIRTSYLQPPKRLRDYHSQVVAHVRAESQAQHLQSLQPYLTDDELEVLRRGRNAVVRKPKRLSAKVYQQATSLETLLGYLYITNPQRLLQLLMQIDLDPNSRLVVCERSGQSIQEVEDC